MRDGAQVHRVARFVLRALLLAAAAVVVVLIGASTAQADDSPPARHGQPGHRLSAGTGAGEARLADNAHRVVHRVTGVTDTATASAREVGRHAPAAQPVTEAVATVADRTVQDATDRVVQVAQSADELVDGPVTDAVDAVLAPIVRPADTTPEAEADPVPPAPSEAGQAAGPQRGDRRTPATRPVPPAAPAAVAGAVPPAAATASQGDAAEPGHDVPPLDQVLGFGAFSGAPNAGSGSAGGAAPAGTLPSGLAAPADVSLGVVAHADDERLFALPLTPGWSPD